MIIIVLFVAIINILINGIGNEVTITIIFFFYESSAQRYLFFFSKLRSLNLPLIKIRHDVFWTVSSRALLFVIIVFVVYLFNFLFTDFFFFFVSPFWRAVSSSPSLAVTDLGVGERGQSNRRHDMQTYVENVMYAHLIFGIFRKSLNRTS